MFEDSEEQVRQKIFELEQEHKAMNDLIDRIKEDVFVDQLQLRRLKKRKLQLKDSINKLQSTLIPDLDA